MNKIALNKPVLICLYGYPGSGKSYVARNLSETLQCVQISGDRIRNELFENPRYDAQENAIVSHLMNYMTQEFLSAGVSVVYDINAMRLNQRRRLRELAKKYRADYMLIWLQIDIESAFIRTQNRDRRTNDDKYAEPQNRMDFDRQISGMQNPQSEDYLVISGKHTFATQKSAIVSRLYQMGILVSNAVQTSVTKPGLINLIPNPSMGRVDLSRRNINIR
jgi:predicted kinase